MSGDDRMTWDLIIDVLKVLERHGFHGAGSQHAGQATGLLGDLTRTYEGTQEAHVGTYVVEVTLPSRAAAPDEDAVVFSNADVRTILTALDEAADYKRDRVAACAGCADQSCATCQFRLQAATAYDQVATRILHAAEASRTAADPQPAPGSSPRTHGQPQAETGKEAGQ